MECVVSLEAGSSESKRIVDGFDRDSGEHAPPPGTDFWNAIEHAHSLGARGAGSKIAIVDALCDVTMPYLAKRIEYVWDTDAPSHDHGTAVALLILMVAPEAQLDIYPIMDNRGPTVDAVTRAIDAAAATDTNIVNLSLGVSKELPDLGLSALPGLGLELMDHFREWLDRVVPDVPPCEICKAARGASSKHMVFAAAGNDAHMVFCPARAEGVISVGFQRTERAVRRSPEAILEVVSATTTGKESPTWDLSLEEFSGLLGTSFASPLYAGVAALGVDPAEYRAFISAMRPGGFAQTFHMALRSSQERPSDLAQATRELYLEALRRLPHVHCKFDADLRPTVPFQEPKLCWSCGVLAQDLYVNGGLFFLEIGNAPAAVSLLTAACDLAPWSPHPFANLGAAFRTLGDLAAAKECYERALQLRPGFDVYAQTLREITSSGSA